MAWTAPMTFVANSVLTAAQLNTHLRDNLNECPTAKATTSGSYFVGNGANSVVERYPETARVATYQTTTSTSFAALATVGPSVSVTTGTKALVFIGAQAKNSGSDALCAISFAISGATTRSSIDAVSARIDGVTANNLVSAHSTDLLTDLTPGTNTFTVEYKVGSGTGTFGDRFIAVLPL